MIPSGCRVRFPVPSPTSAAFPKSFKVGRLPQIYPQRDFVRDEFRDRRYSLRSGLLACSPPRSPLSLRQNRTQDSRDFYTRADHASSPMHASGMLAV
jgi:hypothetical protein